MLTIFHMPPLESMKLYWKLCSLSYLGSLFLGDFTTLNCFEDEHPHIWPNIKVT